MNDGNSVYPKEYFFLHHAVSDRMVNWSDAEVRQWFSDVGRNRGYAGVAHSYHINPSTGAETFAQAGFCLHEYTIDGNKYGWRLVELVENSWNQVMWHCGNWWYNQRSNAVECAGDYRWYDLPDKALMLLADSLRPHDAAIGGILKVLGHQEVFATECPAKIMAQRDKIVDMINNPDKWNQALWPVVAPQPQPQPAPAIKYEPVSKRVVLTKDTNLWDFNFSKWADAKAIKQYKAGEIINVAAIATNPLGSKYVMTPFSYNGGNIRATNGFNVADVKDCVEPADPAPVTPQPEPTQPETPPVTTPEPQPEPPVIIVQPEPIEPPTTPQTPSETPKSFDFETVKAIAWRAFSTFWQAFAAVIVAGYTGVVDIETGKALVIAAVAAGLAALKNAYTKPKEG